MKLDVKSVIALIVMLSAFFGAQVTGLIHSSETLTQVLTAVVAVLSNLLNPVVAKKQIE